MAHIHNITTYWNSLHMENLLITQVILMCLKFMWKKFSFGMMTAFLKNDSTFYFWPADLIR